MPQQKLAFTGNLRMKFLICFKFQTNITVALLSCGSFLPFCVHGVFKCNKLAFDFELTLDMISVALYRYLNWGAEKTIVEGHTASTECNY